MKNNCWFIRQKNPEAEATIATTQNEDKSVANHALSLERENKDRHYSPSGFLQVCIPLSILGSVSAFELPSSHSNSVILNTLRQMHQKNNKQMPYLIMIPPTFSPHLSGICMHQIIYLCGYTENYLQIIGVIWTYLCLLFL